MKRRLGWIVTPSGAMRAWATTLLLIAGFGLALGLTIGYVKMESRRSEQRNLDRARDFCGIITLLDDRNQRAGVQRPPANATPEQLQQYQDAVQFVAAIHAYRIKLGC